MRNLRARNEGHLLVGRRSESFTAAEVGDDEKVPILRAYLKRWKWEVGVFFEGVGRAIPQKPSFEGSPPTTRSFASTCGPADRQTSLGGRVVRLGFGLGVGVVAAASLPDRGQ